MVEELRDILKVKGLQDGSQFQHPVRKFRGVLETASYKSHPKYADRLLAVLSFKDCEILETRPGVTYDHPIVTLEIPLSDRIQSQWGYLSLSLQPFLKEEELSMIDIVGSKMELEVKAEHNGTVHKVFNSRTGTEEARECWVVTHLEGRAQQAETKSINEVVIELADGKTLPQFNTEALRDPNIRQNAELRDKVLNGTLLAEYIEAGFLTRDENGVFHKVG